MGPSLQLTVHIFMKVNAWLTWLTTSKPGKPDVLGMLTGSRMVTMVTVHSDNTFSKLH